MLSLTFLILFNFYEQYPEIWALDGKDPFMRAEEGGETVDDVVSRLTRAMAAMEAQFQG